MLKIRSIRGCSFRYAGRMVPAILLMGATGISGCGLLDVTDPTRLEEHDIANSSGAELLRRGVLLDLYRGVGQATELGGLLSDEFYIMGFGTGGGGDADLRRELVALGLYGTWQAVRQGATLALDWIEANAPESKRNAHMGQMYAVRGYAALRLGDDFCPGFPLHGMSGFTPVFQDTLTTTEAVLEHALDDFELAVTHAADSARILDFARVGKGRTLLGLGRYADAAAAVAGVPTGFVFNAEFDGVNLRNPIHQLVSTFFNLGSVSDREGGNGLGFVTAADPRVRTSIVEVLPVLGERVAPDRYLAPNAPIALASGIEARLIEAEVALAAGGSWLDILNELRANQISPALAPLEDPGSPEERLDLLFRERAFWLFGTGQRLGDLRRLVRLYGRAADDVFPTGAHPGGQVYGTATSLGFPTQVEGAFNPAVTGCTGP